MPTLQLRADSGMSPACVSELSRDDIRDVHAVCIDSYMPFTDDRERTIRSVLQAAESCLASDEDSFQAAMIGWVGHREAMSQKAYEEHRDEVRRMLATAGRILQKSLY